ncbi:MAG: hypothetical protein ACHQYQ_11155 [Bacteriovoracales bacterium]
MALSLRPDFLVRLIAQLSFQAQNTFFSVTKVTFVYLLILRFLQVFCSTTKLSARFYFISEKLEYGHRKWKNFKIAVWNWQFHPSLKGEVSFWEKDETGYFR